MGVFCIDLRSTRELPGTGMLRLYNEDNIMTEYEES